MEIFYFSLGNSLCLAAEEVRGEPMGIVSEEEAIDELQKLINQGLTLFFPTLIFLMSVILLNWVKFVVHSWGATEENIWGMFLFGFYLSLSCLFSMFLETGQTPHHSND